MDGPAVLFLDDRKVLDKARICRLERDRVGLAVVIYGDGLWPAECLVCAGVHIDQSFLIDRHTQRLTRASHAKRRPAVEFFPVSFKSHSWLSVSVQLSAISNQQLAISN